MQATVDGRVFDNAARHGGHGIACSVCRGGDDSVGFVLEVVDSTLGEAFLRVHQRGEDGRAGVVLDKPSIAIFLDFEQLLVAVVLHVAHLPDWLAD